MGRRKENPNEVPHRGAPYSRQRNRLVRVVTDLKPKPWEIAEMAQKWKTVTYGATGNPGCYDNGNGSLAYITENGCYPGIERVKVVPYAKGRGAGYTYYRLAEDASGAFVRAGSKGYD